MRIEVIYILTYLLSMNTVIAQDKVDNNFGLVYEGALTTNKPGAVNIHSASYKLNGINIAANVYTPANYDPSKKYPSITVAHPNGGVKEVVSLVIPTNHNSVPKIFTVWQILFCNILG